jgi:hypothetical protein
MNSLYLKALRMYKRLNIDPLYTTVGYSLGVSALAFMAYSSMSSMTPDKTASYFELVSLGMAAMRLNGI